MSANQRYALYYRANDCSARYEYQYIFDYSELERKPLSKYFSAAQLIDIEDEKYENVETAGFLCEASCSLWKKSNAIAELTCDPMTRFQCSSIEDMLMFEFGKCLQSPCDCANASAAENTSS